MQQASQIIIDDMRTKLELHYDEVHLQRWRKKHANEAKRAPGRRGAYRIFASVAESHRRKLNQYLELPTRVKCILQGPEGARRAGIPCRKPLIGPPPPPERQ